ncbi:hypothetical protein GA0070216_113119 [Micromonospora matsumotoense]|uniref:WD domain-containing protein, G-beta repeat-containing protein n=1 Tax=Micromonospora matsumotoense TaxID=121616 RepID=A0A1C5A4Y4_9ACTN|nr:hypothetical protein GA0070216_113119 [Micromonospora matsumotoense]
MTRPGTEPVSRYGPVPSLAYAPDGATLAIGARDGVVRRNAVDDW